MAAWPDEIERKHRAAHKCPQKKNKNKNKKNALRDDLRLRRLSARSRPRPRCQPGPSLGRVKAERPPRVQRRCSLAHGLEGGGEGGLGGGRGQYVVLVPAAVLSAAQTNHPPPTNHRTVRLSRTMQALSGPAAAAESAAAHTRACRAAHAPGGRWRVRGVGRLAYPPTPRTVSTPRLLPTSLACVPSPHGVVGRDVDHGQAPARLSIDPVHALKGRNGALVGLDSNHRLSRPTTPLCPHRFLQRGCPVARCLGCAHHHGLETRAWVGDRSLRRACPPTTPPTA